MEKNNEVLSYLANLPLQERQVLARLRDQILNLAPSMKERLSRGVPFFYYHNKRAVGFRSSKNHLSFFIMEGNVLNELKDEVSSFDSSSTVIRFSAANPLPDKLIEKLVLSRMSEIERSLPKPTKRIES